ncbi:MAG: hypothetical protein QW723_02235 [Candidatus Bathyarchaeia archaeon]
MEHSLIKLEIFLKKGKEGKYEDPLEELLLSQSINFGDYKTRREHLLNKGKEWFIQRFKNGMAK